MPENPILVIKAHTSVCFFDQGNSGDSMVDSAARHAPPGNLVSPLIRPL